MPERPDCPIEDATIWDILDWSTVVELSKQAPADKYGAVGRPDLALAFAARMLVEAGAESDGQADAVLHRIAFPWIGNGAPATRRQKASMLGQSLGADPVRFMEYLSRKWGAF